MSPDAVCLTAMCVLKNYLPYWKYNRKAYYNLFGVYIFQNFMVCGATEYFPLKWMRSCFLKLFSQRPKAKIQRLWTLVDLKDIISTDTLLFHILSCHLKKHTNINSWTFIRLFIFGLISHWHVYNKFPTAQLWLGVLSNFLMCNRFSECAYCSIPIFVVSLNHCCLLLVCLITSISTKINIKKQNIWGYAEQWLLF